MEGDLVLINEHGAKADVQAALDKEEVDDCGELIVRPAADDSAGTKDEIFQRVRQISADEAASGEYSIFDIVLPTPGFDIIYPSNSVSDFYKEFMQRMQLLGIEVHIWTMPSEIENAIPFDRDSIHAQYDPAYAQKFWLALLQAAERRMCWLRCATLARSARRRLAFRALPNPSLNKRLTSALRR